MALIYFVKADPVIIEPTGERVIPFAMAERVSSVEGQLRAENVQAALTQWQDGSLQITARRLPDRLFTGTAYRTEAPPWFVFASSSPPQ
jgi:hypothetical protein